MARRKLNMDETVDEVVKESVNEIIPEPVDEIKPIKKKKTVKVDPEPIDEINAIKIIDKVNPEKTFTVACDGYLRVRKGPGLDFEVEKQLPAGVTVKVTEEKAGWAKIGPGLWVMKEFLK
jgi:hypothetical protein